ncbi:MAG TPA: MFS transporter [Ktedonobacteraceae bacterium]|nr:MFS transporter [Ktedonobacteraceae bacterium]
MYSLEDDEETSTRWKKKAVAEFVEAAGDAAGSALGNIAAQPTSSADVSEAIHTEQEPARTIVLPETVHAQETMQSIPPEFVHVQETVQALPSPESADAQRNAPKQITASFKELTTPGQSNARSQGVAFAALTMACIGVFFTALDQTVVVTALPQIISNLQIPITQLDHAAWIVSAYLLGFVVAMPLMGRVSDIYGRRYIFLLCLTIFGIGSIFCGLAPMLGTALDLHFLSALGIDTSSPGLIWLIAARLLQAVGGGAIVPVAMAIAGDFYGKERRGLALGIIGAVTEAGGVLGPLYGAVIVAHFGWQYIFYFNVPLVIALSIAAWKLIPAGKRLREKIDWLGAALLAGALTCLSLGLAQQGTSLGPAAASSAAPQNNPVALILAVAFLVAFVLVERKVRWPVIELAIFKRFTFSASALVSLLVGAALIIAMADIPIYVDTVLQGQVLDSGLALMRLTVMIPIGALLGGWLCSRISCRVTGVLGLLFTAAGFFLMSRWPVAVDWNQITLSTVTAGFGFGLVIAPIGTTAINAVRATQAGMSSAIVTALRMVGMMLGLAALTSWALAYFRQLAAKYPSLPATATSAQFATWSKGYAAHLIQSAHTVYTTVFFISMVLCLIAILPAIFLWGSKAPVAEVETEEEEERDPAIYDAPTVPIAAVVAVTEAVTVAEKSAPEQLPPAGLTRPRGKWWRDAKRRRRVIVIAGATLVLLVGGFFATFTFDDDSSPANGTSTTISGTTGPGTPTPVSGPRMMQLALDKGALTSIFASQLNLQQGALSDLAVTPAPNDALILNLNLHIDMNGIHRVMPIELDGVIGLDGQQNLQLSIQHVKRDGIDAGPAAASSMQQAINSMLTNTVMPALHGQLKNVKLISAHTSTTIACGKNIEMLVLQIEAPPIQGIAAQPTPVPFCFTGPIDLNKLLSH